MYADAGSINAWGCLGEDRRTDANLTDRQEISALAPELCAEKNLSWMSPDLLKQYLPDSSGDNYQNEKPPPGSCQQG
jgi:hypothetical protein